MDEAAIFAKYVAAMLRVGQVDAGKARIAIQGLSDQVSAALRDALRPGSSYGDRLLALIDLYMLMTLEMLLKAQAGDRVDFAEAEMKAWSVAKALDRAAEAVRAGDKDTVVAAMMAAESILGIEITSP